MRICNGEKERLGDLHETEKMQNIYKYVNHQLNDVPIYMR